MKRISKITLGILMCAGVAGAVVARVVAVAVAGVVVVADNVDEEGERLN